MSQEEDVPSTPTSKHSDCNHGQVTGSLIMKANETWETWSGQAIKRRPTDLSLSSNSPVVLSKQAELGEIIKDIQMQLRPLQETRFCGSQHKLEALYRKLNARLWSWYDSLPGKMRLSRWTPSLEMVQPNLATLKYATLIRRSFPLANIVKCDLSYSTPATQSTTSRQPTLMLVAIFESIFGSFRGL